MKLYIDSRKREKIIISIFDSGVLLVSKETESNSSSETILSLINLALKENSVSLKSIKEIDVETGPGSYTGTRLGVAVANALSFSLLIPVNKKIISKLEAPEY